MFQFVFSLTNKCVSFADRKPNISVVGCDLCQELFLIKHMKDKFRLKVLTEFKKIFRNGR